MKEPNDEEEGLTAKQMQKEFQEKVDRQCAGCVRSSHGCHCAWIFDRCQSGEDYEFSEEKAKQTGTKLCPRCGGPYTKVVPAMSRRDDKTLICPNCGVEEAVVDWAISQGGDKTGAPFIAALITDIEFTRTLLRAATEQKA